MWRAALVVSVVAIAGACGGAHTGDDVDAGHQFDMPAVIDLPYVAAGAGAVTVDVTVANPGSSDDHVTAWNLDDPAFTVIAAPDTIAAGTSATLTIGWAGAATETIASANLEIEGDVGPAGAEVWAVAGDPSLVSADFAPVTGAGGVTIGESAIVHLPTAPYPAPGDDRVHLFVPDGWRERAAQDVIVHFHGFNTTIDATVSAHLYREHVYASGVDAILAVPQGPVNAASGDFGQLMTPAGTGAFLDEILIVLYRAGVVTRPALGDVTLTSHSGGYQAVAANLDLARQVDLFDSLYGYLSSYEAFAVGGGVLRSDYTSGGGTLANNQTMATDLAAATTPTQRALADTTVPVVYFADTTHEGSTRLDNAYGEWLRWGARHHRRGPRVELRAVTATAGTATATWLAPHDDDLTGWRVETSPDGVTWTLAASAGAADDRASFAIAAAGARVRVVPAVPGVDDPQPSDVYRVAPGAQILVVDGFDRVLDGSFGGLAHDFAARVGEATSAAVATASNEAITEDGFDLSAYPVVIWLCGDESTDDHSVSADEQAAIDAYLAGGGHVIVSGSEIGYELGPTTAGAAWLARTAGAVYAADSAATTQAAGEGLLASVSTFAFGDAGAPYLEDFPDVYTAGSGATVVLRYATGGAAAIGIAGHGAIVGFPLETIDDDATRASVVSDLVAFVKN